MKLQSIAGALFVCSLSACGQGDEFPPQTMEAYAANQTMRADVLARCTKHVSEGRPFKSQSDTAECEKAKQVDATKRFFGSPVKRGGSKGY